MKTAKLVIPGEEHLSSYLEACREFKESGIKLHGMKDPDTFSEWKDTIFQTCENNRLGRGLPDGYVPASEFWLVGDGGLIGAGAVRHRLTPALERFGGHIGYAIRPSLWNQGYGTLQLALLLREAFLLGIDRALTTCDENNIGSYRVMEKNGGVYQDTIVDTIDGQPRRTKRYWFDTASGQAAR